MESLRTRLFLFNHKNGNASSHWWKVTACHRRHHDRYLLSREDPSIFERFIRRTFAQYGSPTFIH